MSSPSPAGLNWAGNYRYTASSLYRPKTVSEIQAIVRNSSRVKALGSRHSFNDIADSEAVQISTENLNREPVIDAAAMTVSIGSGWRYGDLCAFLDGCGFALHNLASLPHISVVGAVATATHGSGLRNGNLATAVEEIEFVDGSGELVRFDRRSDTEIFDGVPVNLGALGIVTGIILKIEKRFDVTQHVFEQLPLSELQDNFDTIMSAGYSVSLFTTWQPDTIDLVWIKRRMDAGHDPFKSDLFGARAASVHVHPIGGISAENCTEQMGLPGAWFDRLPHFRMGYAPSCGEELQSEYFVDRRDAVEAILAIARLGDVIRPYLLVSEIRTIAADNLWLSPNYKRDSAAFHFTWKQDAAVVEQILPKIERELAPFEPRPHWGKLFTMEPAKLRAQYERYEDFVALADRFDPMGKFHNRYLGMLFGA